MANEIDAVELVTELALIGVFMAIVLVFAELGFFYAVPRGGLLLYDNMRFELGAGSRHA